MLFSLRSTALFSASIAASLPVDRSFDLAEPVVAGDPDELAVPALLVPGGGEAILAELPAPLGSLPELLRPPTLAGPDGTPLTPAVPAPPESRHLASPRRCRCQPKARSRHRPRCYRRHCHFERTR